MQKIQLALPEPCHENWNNMTPTDQGRFCNSCAKEVIDFSMMTDTEVLNYFSTLAYDKVCGRVLPSQLNRNITMPKDPKKRLFWYWNYVVMFFMFFSKSSFTKAQTKGEMVTVQVKPQSCTPTVGTMVAGVNIKRSAKIIEGKIIDKNGNPVPFATVKIKRTNTGLSADANGSFSLKVMSNDILEISGMGFETTTINITEQKLSTIILKYAPNYPKELLVTWAGAIRRTDRQVIQKPISIFEVKDSVTGLPLSQASFIVSNINSSRSDTGFADNKGIYQLTRTTINDGYDVRIMAVNYEASEFTISSKEFNERKGPWEVLLKKKTVEKPAVTALRTSVKGETPIRLGGINLLVTYKDPIYLLDGAIIKNPNDIKTNDIENVTVLKGVEAVALFGPEGMNGAIVMTSKNSVLTKVKNLDTVKIASGTTVGRLKICTSTSSYQLAKPPVNMKKDAKADPKEGSPVHSAVYPNPVQRGNLFALALQLKETGDYRIQITDAAGQTVLQKQVNAVKLSQKEMILCDGKWSAGIYFIAVFDNKDQLINTNVFIVE